MENVAIVRSLAPLSCVLALQLAAGAAVAQSRNGPAEVIEGFPEHVVRRMQAREKRLKALKPMSDGVQPYSLVIELQRLWQPGQTVTIAFEGGKPEWHREIEQVASEWTKHANLKFDFGFDAANNRYRHWSEDDTSYAADIRIAFRDGPHWNGYWSFIGTQSIDRKFTRPGEPSMNFEAFDAQTKDDRNNTILHEFGHAIGAHHEHQSPSAACEDELRWLDDDDYIKATDRWGQYVEDDNGSLPGLYTILSGEPTNWSASQVDFAYARLPDTSAYDGGAFDRDSIMIYVLPAWWFDDPDASQCVVEAWPQTLSRLDKQRIAEFYPADDALAANRRNEREATLKVLHDYAATLAKPEPALMSAIRSVEK